MAELRSRRRPRANLPPTGKDEIAGAVPKAFIDDNKTLTMSRAPTFAPAPAVTPAPEAMARYTNEDLQRATQLALNLFVQGQQQAQI